MGTLYRRALRLLPKLGVQVTDLAPGVALVSRGARLRARAAGSDAWLVSRGRAASPTLLSDVAPQGWKTVRLNEDARLLLRRKKGRRHLWDLQQAWYRYLVPEHVAWVLEAYGVNCVLDVGANTGQYAKSLRRAGYGGRIASFEPLPDFVEKLEKAAADDPDWHIYPYALGDEDTGLSMHVVHGTLSSIRPPSDFGSRRYQRFQEERLEDISVRRLDGMLDEVLAGLDQPRPYLKLDTQGYDMEAFAGLGDRVHQFVGMQSEVALVRIYEGMPRMQEAVTTYESAGFEITGMFPVSREKRTGRVLEYDCVMIRPDACL